ncbi:MAG: TolC family protein [candidate division Zixibacteria bacterium]|nr:TolC family protein [candidate division Zixibacteria bacterium]MDH3937363.1 TolC family protein [candidate division Zixibacteria bacterium]MDH4034519.1 TolC family protein [candidate division Zixibacteria bacterium]
MLMIRALSIILLPLLAIAPAQDNTSSDLPVVNIAMVMDGPAAESDSFVGMFRLELTELLKNEFDIRFPADKLVVSDWTNDGITSSIERLLSDEGVDILLTLGAYSTEYVCHKSDLPKPVVAPFVINIDLQKIPFDGHSSKVPNLSYIVASPHLKRTLEALLDLVSIQKISFVLPRRIIALNPKLADNLQNIAGSLGLSSHVVAAGSSAAEVLAAIPADAEAVWVGLMLEMTPEDFQQLANGLIERRLPSYAFSGRTDVKRGLMIGLGEGVDFPRIARRAALNVQRILLGEEAGDIAVQLSKSDRLTVNMSTARAVGVYPDWSVLTEAELVSEPRTEAQQTWTFQAAVEEAVRVNLDLLAADREVLAGRQSVRIALSRLLPQIDLAAGGLLIDDDRAAASFGSQAEQTLTGSVTMTQLLFSDPAFTAHAIEKQAQATRVAERLRVRLDLRLETAVAYLNILRAQTFESVQRDNLQLTRSNLELTRTRQAIGVAGPGEVYRWESQLASNRQSVVDAQAARNTAEIAFNRLLNRPAEEHFMLAEEGPDGYLGIVENDRLQKYMGNKWSFRHFRDFAVGVAVANAPELLALDAAIAAGRRALSSRQRAFWLPRLALSGQLSSRLVERGAGAGDSRSSLLPPSMADAFPESDDLEWNLGLSISLPLYLGGSRFAQQSKAGHALTGLEHQRQAMAERIEQRIRSTLHTAGASRAAIQFSRSAAEAAGKNLDLVADAYSRGVVSILDLLDAQNHSLVAELAAADAVFRFLIDFMKVQRAAGKFFSLSTQQEIDDIFQRLEVYFEAIPASK